MAKIILTTKIKNEINICFDLSRSIDLHKISTAHTNEKAIDGCITGLIELNKFVTWKSKHFGVTQRLTTKITQFEFPAHFRDEQIRGAFKFIKHDHYFEKNGNETIMLDIFEFQSLCGFLGKIVDALILKKYLTQLLITRNEPIKEFAETEKWRSVIQQPLLY